MLQLSEATALRIKELMRKRSLTQYALAKKSGLSPSTLNTILAGKNAGQNRHDDIEYLPGLRD